MLTVGRGLTFGVSKGQLIFGEGELCSGGIIFRRQEIVKALFCTAVADDIPVVFF